MTPPLFFAYPKQGEILQKQFWYSQSVRLGDQIKISGQGIFPFPPFHVPNPIDVC